jgi:hypothetical protein
MGAGSQGCRQRRVAGGRHPPLVPG